MSTTLDSVSQTPRKSNRSVQKDPKGLINGQSNPHLPNDVTEPSTSPATPPRLQQTDATDKLSNGVDSYVGDTTTTKKKKSKSAKKPPRQISTPGHVSDGPAKHRHNSSQPNSNPSDATPAKLAYAGPTFHNSPAPNALPLPSIFSKSVPSVAAPNLEDFGSEDESSAPEDGTPSRPKSKETRQVPEREASPLDFMFKAARQAKASPRTETPNGTHLETPPSGGQARNHERHHSSGGGLFHFEADVPGTGSRTIGGAFATPYNERMKALRFNNSLSNTDPLQLDEEQRKAKSEALKKLLFSQTPQRPASASPRLHDQANPFDKPPTSQQVASIATSADYRHGSGPSTPRTFGSPQHAQQQHNPLADFPALQHSLGQGSPRNRTPSSNLRQEVQPIPPYTHVEPYQAQPSPQQTHFQGGAMQPSSAHFTRTTFSTNDMHAAQAAPAQSTLATAKPTSEEMADQMRRFLKLGSVAKQDVKY